MDIPPESGTPAPRHATRTRPYRSRPERRRQIVDATIAIIAEQGLVAWKTAELARRVGVSEPTLFRHFANKEEILSAAVQREAEAARELIRNYHGAGDAWSRVEGLLLTITDYFAATGGGPIVILTGQVIRVSPEIRQDILATVQLVRDTFRALFSEAVSEAGNAPGVDPDNLADLAIAIIQSSALRYVMSQRAYPLRERAVSMLTVLRHALGGERGGSP